MAKENEAEVAPTPKLSEFSSTGLTGVGGLLSAYTDGLIENEDEILQAKGGGDLSVYEKVLRDDQVKSTFQQRRQAVTSKAWGVEPGGTSAIDKKAADFIEEALNHVGWDNVTDKMLYGLFYGYAVAETLFVNDGSNIMLDDIRVRNRGRFKFDNDRELFLCDTLSKPIPMPSQNFWHFTAGADNDDRLYGLGLAHWLYWPVFFKRNGLKFWLVFLEKFGMPTAIAKAPKGITDSQVERKKVLEALQALQTDSGIVVPDQVVIELVQATRSGTADYTELNSKMNAAISKIVLSQTMTTDDGSSRSQSEVHLEVRDEVINADADLICESFNRHVVRNLIDWNFAGAAYPRVFRKTEEEEDLNQIAERDSKMYNAGYQRTPESVEEIYGEGFEKIEVKEAPEPIPEQQVAEDFAEIDALTMTANAHRRNQDQIVKAAQALADKYPEIIAPRINGLLSFLEESGDLVAFREHLTELIGEVAPSYMIEPIQKAGIVSRLLGSLQGQRNA